jgi:hypothetical protein
MLTHLRYATVFSTSTLEPSFSPIKEFILAVQMLFSRALHYPVRRYGYVAARHARAAAGKPATIGILGASSANAQVQSTGAFAQRPRGTPL